MTESSGDLSLELVEGWEVGSTAPDAAATPVDLESVGGLAWRPARVPGTAAAAVGADGRDFDLDDWWFRTRLWPPVEWEGGRLMLELGGIATLAEVFLDGELVLESQSMWQAHTLDVTGRVRPGSELHVVCRALAPRLAARRRPAARWRTRVVNQGNLRWYRTMILGRSPGFAPGPAAVGPWRPVRLVRRSATGVDALQLASRLDGQDGVVTVACAVRGTPATGEVRLGDVRAPLDLATGTGEARLERAARWWPHTHGEPALHHLEVVLDGEVVARRRVGFRCLEWPEDFMREGLSLAVNGVPVWVRGAVWTPADLVSMAPCEAELRALLEQVRDAGMNMLRVAGTGAYEAPAFHALCDELGILVWQDLMFANLDYPLDDEAFRAGALEEGRAVVGGLKGHPSSAVVCGSSEVEQQPAMLGLPPDLARHPFWEEDLPALVAEAGLDCPYLRSTPCGGALPFHPGGASTHYFGVSGYFLPPSDARRAGVRFAAECLAFANVPDQVAVPVHHPDWKTGVQRDAGSGWSIGAGWDFDDVRDGYLSRLYGVEPVALRRYDHDRYLELSRAVPGEVMAEVLGEWRRAGSGCHGALVLWCKDMLPGAGLGLIDHRGEPKLSLGYVRRALAPVAVWTTDEGVGGVAIHVANDRPEPLRATLRVTLLSELRARVAEVKEAVRVAPHAALERNVDAMVGHFVDAAWAYRFGPPAQDAIVVSLLGPDSELLSQTVRFPAGRPTWREPAERLGVRASTRSTKAGEVVVELHSEVLLHCARLQAGGFRADDDGFWVEPGRPRRIRLAPRDPGSEFRAATLTALNLAGAVRILPTGG